MRLKKLLRLICAAILLISSTVQAQDFNPPVNPEGTGQRRYAGAPVSMKLFNNIPSIAFAEEENAGSNTTGDEYPAFYQATDSTGSSWGSSTVIDDKVDLGTRSIGLVELSNGLPAVFYIDVDGVDTLFYSQAWNTSGTNWKSREIVYTGGGSFGDLQAAIVNDRPAVAFIDYGSTDYLYFIRASNSTGSSYGSPVAITSTTDVLDNVSFAIVNGLPAVSYFDATNDDLYFAIASNVNGSAWSTPVVVHAASSAANLYPALAEVNGRPAIAILDSRGVVYYVRANNASGSSWPSGLTAVDTPSSTIGDYIQLGVVEGQPAIAFECAGCDDHFWVEASDSTGATWGDPLPLNTVKGSGGLSLAIGDNNAVHLAYAEGVGDSIGYLYRDVPYDTDPTWDTVGTKGFSDGAAYYTSLVIDDGGAFYLAYRDDANSSKATVKKYDGSSWTTVGSTGFSDGSADYIKVAIDTSGTPYVAYSDGNASFKLTVKKYNGSSWTTVGTSGVSAGNITDVSIDFDGNNNLYVGYRDVSNSNKATVMKYDGSSWGAVGGAGFTASSAFYPYMTLDNTDTLYIAFSDGSSSSKTTLMKYNGSNWVAAGSAGFSAGAASYIGLVFDSNNNPYVSYRDGGNSFKATTMTYNGSSWSTVGSAGFSADDPYDMNIKIDDNDTLYVTYRDDGNSQKATVMKYNGSSWVAVGGAGFTDAKAYNPSLLIDNGALYVAYGDNNNSDKATVMKYDTPVNTWDGSKWSLGTPNATSNACIESNTAPTTFTCKNVTINSGFSLNTGTSEVVTINGDLQNNGNGVTGTGTIKFSNDGASRVKGDTIAHEGTVIVETGCTLNTNDLLCLKSGATNTGSIGESAGTIIGNVMAQRYSIGKRCYRLYAHPFSSSIALSQLTDEIDITGSGGATNGFTPTQSNASSAYWFDPTSADTSASSVNSGWKAFTSANSADWDRHELLLLFLRGAKGEGLNGQAYSPSASTFEAVGTINQGQQVVSLAKGSNTTFAAVGNPFPSGVQMNTVTLGANVGTNYYAWDASVGADGAYVTNPFTLSYILPAYAGFFTTISASTTITFEESDKAAGGQALHKTTAPANMIELIISDSNTKWDRLLINLDANAMEVEDTQDAKKLYNPNLDFYTLSKDGARLAVDVRPYNDTKSIPLGLTAYNRYNKYVIKTGMFDIPAGTKLILHDKYLNKKEELKAGTEYWFDVTTDTLSQGNQRFEINMVGKPTTHIIEAIERTAQMQLIPNPAHNQVKVSFDKIQGEAQIIMMSVTGQLVYHQVMNTTTGSVTIPLANVPNGIYIVELQSKNARFAEKLIKE